jgi:hypothetical protein
LPVFPPEVTHHGAEGEIPAGSNDPGKKPPSESQNENPEKPEKPASPQREER